MKRYSVIVFFLLSFIYSYAQKDSVKAVSYDRAISMGDMAFASTDYITAKRFYKIALKAKPTEKYPQEHIDDCDKKMASSSWMGTSLNCPCYKGKATPLKNFTDIYVITSDDSTAHAVLPGSVVSVIMDGNSRKYAVIVKHGKYVATYSELIGVEVKTGDDIKEGQEVGLLSKKISSYTFNFSLLLGKDKQDAMSNVHCK